MRFRKTYVVIAIVLLASSCKLQPDADDLLNDMVVVTNYDESVDFGTFLTYTMPVDSIGFVQNDATLEWITGAYPTLVSNAVRHNMSAIGRTRVDKTQSPSLAVNVYVIENLQVFQNVVYPNYYGYPGGGYGGLYGYPGYYNYPQVVNYQSQTAILVIEFVDLVHPDANNNVRVIWNATIGDLVNSVDRDRKVVEAIDQAFAQSEYLKP